MRAIYTAHLQLMALILSSAASHFAIPSRILLLQCFPNTLNLYSSLRITQCSSVVPSHFLFLNAIMFAAKSSCMNSPWYCAQCTKCPNGAPDEAVTPGSVRSQAGCGAGGNHVSSERWWGWSWETINHSKRSWRMEETRHRTPGHHSLSNFAPPQPLYRGNYFCFKDGS
jgi:hypothetical protein